MVLVRDDNRGLHVAQGLQALEGIRILGDVDALVGDALLVQRAVGRVALYTGRLCVNRNGHGPCPLC